MKYYWVMIVSTLIRSSKLVEISDDKGLERCGELSIIVRVLGGVMV